MSCPLRTLGGDTKLSLHCTGLRWSLRLHPTTRGRRVTIDSLPDDILENIFLLGHQLQGCSNCSQAVLDVDLIARDCDCMHTRTQTVSSVSRRWRAVALDCSRLWNTIRVTPSTSPAMLHTYLERSKIRPLDVQVIVPQRRDVRLWSSMTLCALSTVLEMLLEVLPRWRELRIVTPFSDLIMAIFARLSADNLAAPRLEVMEVECPFRPLLGTNGNGNMYPRPFPGGAPQLQHVQLYRCGFSLVEDEPYLSLRSFSIASAGWTLADLHSLAVTCPNLTHLAIRSSYRLEAHVALHFPALKTLRIGDYFQNDTILRLLTAPELEVLQIEEMEIQHHVMAGWYIGALQNREDGDSKFPKLRSLRLHMPGSPEDPSPLIVGEPFRHFLRLFPTITHLAFVGYHVEHLVQGFTELLLGHTEELLLPKLTHLTLGVEQDSQLCSPRDHTLFHAALALVEVRRAVGAPLRRVQLPQCTLRAERQLFRRILLWRRKTHIADVTIERLSSPYPSDIWLGYRWGLEVLYEGKHDASLVVP